jgi:hypothetical protein
MRMAMYLLMARQMQRRKQKERYLLTQKLMGRYLH